MLYTNYIYRWRPALFTNDAQVAVVLLNVNNIEPLGSEFGGRNTRKSLSVLESVFPTNDKSQVVHFLARLGRYMHGTKL
jgi:hypothetical protein